MEPHQAESWLRDWAAGRSLAFAELAFTMAFASKALCEFYSQEATERLHGDLDEPQDSAWSHYYASHADFAIDLLQGMELWEGIPVAEFVSYAESLLKGDQEAIDGLQEFLSDPDLSGEREEAFQAASAMLTGCFDRQLEECATGGPEAMTEQEKKEAGKNQALVFAFSVFLPCVVRHKKTPQKLFALATQGERPNLDAIEKLVTLDRSVIHLAEFRALERHSDSEFAAAFREVVSKAYAAGLYRPSATDIRRSAISFLSYVADLLGEKATVPDLMRLHELADAVQGGTGEFELSSESVQPASITRQVRRLRKEWKDVFNNVLADTELKKAVRVLRGDAA